MAQGDAHQQLFARAWELFPNQADEWRVAALEALGEVKAVVAAEVLALRQDAQRAYIQRRVQAAIAVPAAQRKQAALEAEAEHWRQLEAVKREFGEGNAAPCSPVSLMWKTREPLRDSCAQSDRTPLLPMDDKCCGHQHED